MAKGKSALALALKKKIGSNDEIQKVSHWIDSGFPPLNKAISGRYDGGFPCGRIVRATKRGEMCYRRHHAADGAWNGNSERTV